MFRVTLGFVGRTFDRVGRAGVNVRGDVSGGFHASLVRQSSADVGPCDIGGPGKQFIVMDQRGLPILLDSPDVIYPLGSKRHVQEGENNDDEHDQQRQRQGNQDHGKHWWVSLFGVN
ncbi:MAG TPA: hypothetical protein EYQ75_04520 [Planctomycetaceae bacterium]|nr:hypothetical protein [Planctomycetaceae bacterium]